MSQHNGDHQSSEPAAEALTALALNQLHGDERAAAEAQLAAGGDAARFEVRDIETLASALAAARAAEPLPPPSAELRKLVEGRLTEVEPAKAAGKAEPARSRRIYWQLATGLAAVSLAAVACAMLFPALQANRANARRAVAEIRSHFDFTEAQAAETSGHSIVSNSVQSSAAPPARYLGARSPDGQRAVTGSETTTEFSRVMAWSELRTPAPTGGTSSSTSAAVTTSPTVPADPKAGESVMMMVTPRIVVDEYELNTELRNSIAQFELRSSINQAEGHVAHGVSHGVKGTRLSQKLVKDLVERVKETTSDPREQARLLEKLLKTGKGPGTEQYERIVENTFLSSRQQPLSTFSIDVDTASYANVRRFLNGGRLPPANAVRIEELVNYFKYDYPQPKGREPFSVNMEVAECPWQTGHLLLRVGLKGKEVPKTERPASNLVFLLDVSGSMQDENKLPLLKTAMNLLVGELGENDRVSIVTYAGEAGLRLAPTRGHDQAKIKAAIDSLSAGGSTNGSAGINLAYEQAAAYFVQGGTNRVILCTDGDLNVGITSDDALVELIKQKAAGGTFLTVLGFGEGNLKDAKLEKLADNGNGLYAYIDSVREARKVLVEQLTGSTITIAKDVKIQIEFNPAQIAAYRLLGYENRTLAAEDFSNDQKDAGDIGAGHTVTALYELVPAGAAAEAAPAGVEPLKYQRVQGSGFRVQEGAVDSRLPTPDGRLTDAAKSGELLTLKLRYKEPDGVESRMIEYPLKERGGSFQAASRDLQFAAAVASFGMVLRGSEHRGSGNLAAVLEIASTSLGEDAGGYRAEFVDLVRKAQALGGK
jgi:Ca-activated chloride channel family protein